jgi:PAS domain S-box-containing protein
MPPARHETKPPGALAVFGRWSFMVAVAAGFAIGVGLLPAAGNQLISAAAMLGAIAIMAAMALRAARAEAQVEALQLKLLDERSYHAFVDGAVEGFFRTTRDGRYLIANPALARMYGYDSAEQLKSELISASLYVDAGRRNEFHALMKSQRVVRYFVSQIRRRDGELIWISESAHCDR